MARPTDDKKESKVILRINDETRKSIEKASQTAGLSMSEYIRDILTSKHDNELSKYGITTDIIAELAQIVKLCGGDLKDVLNDMGERLNSGELTIDGGQLVIDDEIDLTRLREIAERYHKEPQEVLNRLLERAIG